VLQRCRSVQLPWVRACSREQQDFDLLASRLPHFAELNPTSFSVTWGAGGASPDRSLELATITQSLHGVDTELHLSCTNLTTEKADSILRVGLISYFVQTTNSERYTDCEGRGDSQHFCLTWRWHSLHKDCPAFVDSIRRSSSRARTLDSIRPTLCSRHRSCQIYPGLARILVSLLHQCRR
jgi:hypothetical protein